MLWSISNGKSGTTWLDRLRTAKGFPENGVTDLDQFLQNPNSPTPETPDPQTNSVGIPDPAQTGNEQLFDMMTDVLHDLFNFGDKCSNPNKIKKSARKQANPRICALSGNGSHESNAAPGKAGNVTLLRSTDSNCGAEGMKELDKLENEGDGNLTGFSRTEVTVIDTSYESWKFDKLLYRKKNVWKVRDKKGKSEIAVSKKKRKTSVAMEEDQRAVKKLKVDDEKEGSAEEGELPLTEVSYSNHC